MQITQFTRNAGWKIETNETLSDNQAAEIEFRAEPEQVVLGAHVEVIDAGGTRIGYVKRATYHTAFGLSPSYVVVDIELR